MRDILFYPDKRLRKKSADVDSSDWGTHLETFIKELYVVMEASDGVGLAAPQVGVHKKILVYKTYDNNEEKNNYLINPSILVKEGSVKVREGCLSLPGVFEDVERFQSITVQAQTFEGESFTVMTASFSSIIIQHENDHLYGKLFIDRLSLVRRTILLAKYNKQCKQ